MLLFWFLQISTLWTKTVLLLLSQSAHPLFCTLVLLYKVRLQRIMLKRSGKRHPYFIPNICRKALSFSLLSMMVAVGSLWMIFFRLRKFLTIPSFLWVFFFLPWMDIRFFQMLFSVFVKMIIWFLFFIDEGHNTLLMCCITFWLTLCWTILASMA